MKKNNRNVLGLDGCTNGLVDNFEDFFDRGVHIDCIYIRRSNAASRAVLMCHIQEATPLVGSRTWSTGLVIFQDKFTIVRQDNWYSKTRKQSEHGPRVVVSYIPTAKTCIRSW